QNPTLSLNRVVYDSHEPIDIANNRFVQDDCLYLQHPPTAASNAFAARRKQHGGAAEPSLAEATPTGGALPGKVAGLGVATYCADPVHRFDGAVTAFSVLDVALAAVGCPATEMLSLLKSLRVLRVARVLRILRLLKNLKGLRDLVFTLVLAFPGLCNVGALLGLVMFMYAVLG
ncbi:MAG: ion transporter, partial [Pseudomonadota bacterium]|nr:ion transporter [Pseudomonadota bacterium]